MDLSYTVYTAQEPNDTGQENERTWYHRFQVGPERRIWQGCSCTLLLDSLESFVSLKSRAFLILLRHRRGSGIYYEGLVVQMVEGNDAWEEFQDVKRAYGRIGIFIVQLERVDLPRLPDLTGWVMEVILVKRSNRFSGNHSKEV